MCGLRWSAVRSFYPCGCRPTMGPMTRVKICGVTRPDDALLAAELRAWAVGPTFSPESPRACDPAAGAEIGAALQPRAGDSASGTEVEPGRKDPAKVEALIAAVRAADAAGDAPRAA